MSLVNLTGFFTYEPNRRQRSVFLENIPLPENMEAPEAGLTLLFGLRDATEEIARQIITAESKGLMLDTVEVQVEVGSAKPGRITEKHTEQQIERATEAAKKFMAQNPDTDLTLEEIITEKLPPLLSERRYIHLEKLNEDLQEEVENLVRDWCDKNRIPFESPFQNSMFITRHPQAIDAIAEHEKFRHIELFVYRIEDQETRTVRQVATLMSKGNVHELRPSRQGTHIELPTRLRTKSGQLKLVEPVK